MENVKPKLLKLFESNPNTAYEFGDIVKELGTDYKRAYNDLKYLVRCKIVTEALPGLCGGRKKTYFLRNKNK